MSNIRPGDATHTDSAGHYFKSGLDLNWLKWSQGCWVDVGTLPKGTLTILPPAATVELEKFGAPMAPHMPSAIPSPQPIQPSGFPIWPCTATPPAPMVHDQAQAYAKLVTSLDSDAPYTAYFVEYRFVGSRITCNPPPLDTDQDVLVLVNHNDVVCRKMLAAGFTKEGSNPTDLGGSVDKESVFHSYRKGDMNYIVTGDRDFYERFSTATELARKYNLMAKADRIQLFQAVLYGKWWA